MDPWRLWRALRPCPGCGRPAPGPDGVCRACRRRWLQPAPALSTPGSPGAIVALGRYRGGLGRLVRAAKYRPDARLLDALGAALGAAAQRAARGAAAQASRRWVVPVPPDVRRRRRRGVDHAGRLARAVAAAWDPPLRVEARLARTRPTRPQAGLSDAARRRNLAGAVAWVGPAPPAGVMVLLVDDVLTTGATARACRDALVRAGVADVIVAVVARAR